MTRSTQLRSYLREGCAPFRSTRERFGGLSNMATGFPVRVNGLLIHSSEALYQACRFPDLPELQRIIIGHSNPMAAKAATRPQIESTRADWQKSRVAVMRWALQVKLACNWEKFGRLLTETGDLPIVEDSRRDAFWGGGAPTRRDACRNERSWPASHGAARALQQPESRGITPGSPALDPSIRPHRRAHSTGRSHRTASDPTGALISPHASTAGGSSCVTQEGQSMEAKLYKDLVEVMLKTHFGKSLQEANLSLDGLGCQARSGLIQPYQAVQAVAYTQDLARIDLGPTGPYPDLDQNDQLEALALIRDQRLQ